MPGFENPERGLSGGIQATGNDPSKAKNKEEFMVNLTKCKWQVKVQHFWPSKVQYSTFIFPGMFSCVQKLHVGHVPVSLPCGAEFE
ncbi:L-rhamnose isomerase [Diplocloster modestus]|uniref:L-rhamnose isomerase n=1 Tax=Diplocloster modestus TaxID=2850322 RepID=UPI001EE84CE8|nr:L-rhamnose isomerase [Diplocloster modestus]